MEAAAEVARLEAAVDGDGASSGRREADALRLVELYLLHGADEQQILRIPYLLGDLVAAILRGDPLYPRLCHARARIEVMFGGLGNLEEHAARAAALERDAFDSGWKENPAEAALIAAEWADWAWELERWADAGEGYQLAQHALERQILHRTVGTRSRLDVLATGARYAPRAAVAFVRAGDPRSAVAVLDRAGEVLTVGGSQQRDLLRLAEQGHQDLYDEVLAARQALAAAAAGDADAAEARRRENEVSLRVRSVPGFERFASPSRFDDVKEAALESPIVYLAASDKGGVGLLVDGATISSIPLEVTLEELGDMWLPFVRALNDGQVDEQKDTLVTALGLLGARVTLPVSVLLGSGRPFVLIPFGLFGLLPIASGYVDRPGPEPGTVIRRHLIDPAHVTTAPSARVWHDSRRRTVTAVVDSALVVTDPWPLPATFDRLRLSDAEGALVTGRMPATVLSGPQATTSAVLDEIGRHGLLHFDCHGYPAEAFGFAAQLLLARREVLTIEHLRALPSLPARLVVLSACSSAQAAVRPAQVVSMPFVMLALGAVGVVGTSWPVDEIATLLLLDAFYRTWWDRKVEPRAALGAAKRFLATSTAEQLRSVLAPAALASDPAAGLRAADSACVPFAHPWYWSGFFLAGS